MNNFLRMAVFPFSILLFGLLFPLMFVWSDYLQCKINGRNCPVAFNCGEPR